jgi:hypothetical protein
MPTSYRIDRERGIIFSRGYGVLTDEDLQRHTESALADPAFDPGLDQLYDFTDVMETRVSAECIRELGRRSVYGPGARRAFVTPKDHQFGLARMFEITSEDRSGRVVVFRSLAEARAWLGLEPEEA